MKFAMRHKIELKDEKLLLLLWNLNKEKNEKKMKREENENGFGQKASYEPNIQLEASRYLSFFPLLLPPLPLLLIFHAQVENMYRRSSRTKEKK